ncbi:hypothetical protein C8F01DRAFT_45883 [Mycena amicta]|nr:hypothetical protein C8F01DRAFT_45883 [Mycena amicta]
MHPSLKLSSLAQLPPVIKSSALAAARGSLRDLDAFLRFIADDPRFEKEFLPRLICVLYVALDPTPISGFLPDAPTSPADNNAFAEVVARAMRAVCSVGLWIDRLEPHQKTSPAVLREVWPRMWAWMQFHDAFWDSGLVAFPHTPAMIYYLTLSAVTTLGYESTLLTRQVLDTPHFFDFLGEAWARFVWGPTNPCRSMFA